VLVDGTARVVLGGSGTSIRFAGDDGNVESGSVAELVSSGRLALASGGRPSAAAEIGLAGLPPDAVAGARWWEAHIIEVVYGVPPDAPPGTLPLPHYNPERTSLSAREQAKAES
jgi:hypothetical protein